jgi:hypothetical protein
LAEVGDSILLLIPQFPKLLHRGWPVPGVMIIAESKYFPNLLVQNQFFQNADPVVEIVFPINDCFVP